MHLLTPRGGIRGTRSGLTLLELIIAMGVLVLASGLFLETLISTQRVRQLNHERSVAAEAGRLVLESMRSEDFEEIFARFNLDPADDPEGEGTAHGARFRVTGLRPLPGTADDTVGEIFFPSLVRETEPELNAAGKGYDQGRERDEAEGITMGNVHFPGPKSSVQYLLREDYRDVNLGMPRDLNGDNVVDDRDHSRDYIRLPVCVQLEWQGSAGPTRIKLYSMFAANRPERGSDSGRERPRR